MQRTAIEAIEFNKEKTGITYLKGLFRMERETVLIVLISIFALVYFTVVMIPVISLFEESGMKNSISVLMNSANLSSVLISVTTSTLATMAAFLTGTPVVYLLVNSRSGWMKRIFEVLIGMPTVIPPAVAGIGLLLAFGRDGMFGGVLYRLNIQVVFTPVAVILAQFFVSSGFYVQVLKNGVDSVSSEILDASYVLGAGRIETFIRVVLPMLKRTIFAGLVLSWTRALGEFGATIMFAGNVLGKTRTAPLQIYTLMQTDIRLAASLAVVMVLISSVMLFMTKLLLHEKV